ncbi:MAG: glycosyltransferase family 2 protein [Salinivirgaceae bacterium]|nr:glycosyltransferase family 2 protein [Salinivirgaceae bacterium]
MNKTLSIIIPAYNEADCLKDYLPIVLGFCEKRNYYLIIVNDGSKDATAEICEKIISSSVNGVLINHKVNRGYGGAIKSGVYASNADYIVTIDADGQHNLEDVDILFQKILKTDADMIVGSRKGQKEASGFRSLGKLVIRKFAKFLIPNNIYDINSGMKMYNSTLGKKYASLCPDGMSYSDTILLAFVNFRHLVIEHPIRINQRLTGESTIGTMTAIETIKEILNLVILFNPLKVFFPLAMFVFFISVLWGIPIVLRGDGVSVGTLLGLVTSLLLFAIGLLAEQISQIRKMKVNTK